MGKWEREERVGEVVEDDFIKGRGKSRGVQLLPPKKARFQLQLPPLGSGGSATRGPMRVQVRAAHRRCGGAGGTGYPWPEAPRPPLARVGESAPWGPGETASASYPGAIARQRMLQLPLRYSGGILSSRPFVIVLNSVPYSSKRGLIPETESDRSPFRSTDGCRGHAVTVRSGALM